MFKTANKITVVKPKSAIRLLRANKLSFCHLSFRFSVTMEPHCALKTERHLFKNKSCYHHNSNDRFGLKNTLDGHYSYSLDITLRQRSVGTRFRNLV